MLVHHACQNSSLVTGRIGGIAQPLPLNAAAWIPTSFANSPSLPANTCNRKASDQPAHHTGIRTPCYTCSHALQDSDEPGTAAHALYVRTHGAFAPGEQRRRPYDWAAAGVDPAAHRFGATEKAQIVNGVGKALNPGLDDDAPQAPQIVNRRVEEHRLTAGEVLGAPRLLGAGDRGLPPDFTYGKPSLPKVRLV